MYYLEFLTQLHARLLPPTYLEIGVRRGDSLVLARGQAIGVDPQPKIRVDLDPERVRIHRQTSDAFFARRGRLSHLARRVPVLRRDRWSPALSFIDGLHLSEFALRDFMNVERLSHWTGVVVFDDILPKRRAWAARERQTRTWTGDVFKLVGVLSEHRPDLMMLRVDVEPTGLLLVLGLDSESTVLRDRYKAIAGALDSEDPQHVGRTVLRRRGTLDPEQVLDSSVWQMLRTARSERQAAGGGRRELRELLQRDFGADLTGLPGTPQRKYG